jgi:hypothetical protein
LVAVLWFSRRRFVRLHQLDPGPTVEGIYVGKVDGHYRLVNAAVVETPERTVPLEWDAYVPAGRVVLMEVRQS